VVIYIPVINITSKNFGGGKMSAYDITFVGHMCFDEITPYKGETKIAPGSAVLCGAMVAARVGKKVAVVTKMSEKDKDILKPMQDLGIDIFTIPSEETTYSVVIHPSENVDERKLILKKSAGIIKINEVPELNTKYMHLAGISNTEFDMDLIRGLKGKGYNLSIDMQSFVRQVDPVTCEVSFKDDMAKTELAKLMSKIKMDIVEAEVLTGTNNLEKAAITFEEWGCNEIIITQAEGVLARVNGKTYYEKFSNRSIVGRTGRGDTTFSAYLSHRIDHDVEESLKFAAALVSIKMEKAGPFDGTLEDVYLRIKEKH
jgi:sugar/nucleoside kinase (ribokinase family)